MAELLSDFLKRELEPRTHIIGRGVLPVKGKMILYGDPKTNKSFVALNMALAISRGQPLFGAVTTAGAPLLPVYKSHRTLYIEQEIGEDGLRDRLRCISNPEEAIECFIKTRDMTMRMDSDKGREVLHREIDQVKPDVVILDPLAKFHLSDENSAQQMGVVLRVGDVWVEQFGCAIIYVHHTSKEAARPEDRKRGPQRIRGSSAMFGDADALVEVERLSASHHKEPVLRLSFELRRGEPIDPIYIQRLVSGECRWMGEGYHWGRPAKPKEGSIYDGII